MTTRRATLPLLLAGFALVLVAPPALRAQRTPVVPMPDDRFLPDEPLRAPSCFRMSAQGSQEVLQALEDAGFDDGVVLQWIPEPRIWRAQGLQPPREIPLLRNWAFWWPASGGQELMVWWPLDGAVVHLTLTAAPTSLQGLGSLEDSGAESEALRFTATATPAPCPSRGL